MNKDLACGLVALAIATLYLVATAGLRTSALGDVVGSAGFPKIIGWGLAMVGALLILQSLRGRRAAGAAWIPSEAFATNPLWAAIRGAGIVAIIAMYLLLLEPLGYILSVALLVGATAVYLGAAPGWRSLAVAGLGAIALWLLFVMLLGIPLPSGAWTTWS
jgi:putative tricarboxylic transport membrane protein